MVDTYSIYWGKESGNLDLVLSDISDLEIDLPVDILNYYIDYYWRINAENQFGITTGDEWSFKSIAFVPPLPTGITLDYSGDPDDEDYGEQTGIPTGENNMITVRHLLAAANGRIWLEDI